MRILISIAILSGLFLNGCSGKIDDQRVNMRGGVGSDTLVSNYVTRPIGGAAAALLGRGLIVTDVATRRNDAGLLEIRISGKNESPGTKLFRYRVEWLDESNFVIETKTSVWLRLSVMEGMPYEIKAVAPRVNAVNFRIDTRKWE